MPYFLNSRRGYMIMTNFKVMSSSLNAQPVLEQINFRAAVPKLLNSRIRSKSALDLYLLVRNPYERLVSFFTEKFIRRPKGQIENPHLAWQDSQKVFFHQLGIHDSFSEEVKVNRFLKTSFSDFVAMVPRVYRHDSHLHPQCWLQWVRIKGMPLFQPNISRVIRIDTEEKSFLSEQLQLDMTIKTNATDHPSYSQMCTAQDFAIMNSVYATDFEQFGYAKH